MDYSTYRTRIKNTMKQLKDGEVLLLFGATGKIRNRDVEYKFRQDSDFYYLTGFTEADAILILKNSYSAMFVLPKNKEKEIWTGIRTGKSDIKKNLGLSEGFDLGEWKLKKEELLTDQHTLFYFFGKNTEQDIEILKTCESLNQKLRDGRFGPEKIQIPDFLHELRMIKSAEEISIIKESCEITKKGHITLFRNTKPGMFEYELESMLESVYLENGAWGGGYGHIVATGKNATILHYTFNNSRIGKNDLILVDSGAEKNYYTADVTRVFPAGKKFSSPQKDIYGLVLSAQKRAISLSVAGRKFQDIHEKTVEELCAGLKHLKLLKGSVEGIIESGSYRKFYMHRTGHWLGMDVHDVGKYFSSKKSRPLRNGQITTVEPGLYFDPEDKSVPEYYRGIGIRIEDDILINGNKPVNLTAEIPKEIDEIEALRN